VSDCLTTVILAAALAEIFFCSCMHAAAYASNMTPVVRSVLLSPPSPHLCEQCALLQTAALHAFDARAEEVSDSDDVAELRASLFDGPFRLCPACEAARRRHLATVDTWATQQLLPALSRRVRRSLLPRLISAAFLLPLLNTVLCAAAVALISVATYARFSPRTLPFFCRPGRFSLRLCIAELAESQLALASAASVAFVALAAFLLLLLHKVARGGLSESSRAVHRLHRDALAVSAAPIPPLASPTAFVPPPGFTRLPCVTQIRPVAAPCSARPSEPSAAPVLPTSDDELSGSISDSLPDAPPVSEGSSLALVRAALSTVSLRPEW
jgi:hypothetical protein